jgi:hypothetical protein
MEAGPEVAGDPDELRPDRLEVALRSRSKRIDREVARERVAKLGGEQLGAQPTFADGPGSDDLVEVALEGVHGRGDLDPHGLEGLEDGDGIRTGLAAGIVDRLVHERGDAGQPLDGRFGLEQRDRSSWQPDQRGTGDLEHLRHTTRPPQEGGAAMAPRRELASQQSMEAAAEHEDVGQWVPGLVPEDVRVESQSVERLEDDAPVDGLVRREGAAREGLEGGRVARVHRESCLPAGLGEVRPAIVVPVVADARGQRRKCLEEVVEERPEGVVEGAHGGRSGVGRQVREDGQVGHLSFGRRSGTPGHPTPRVRL